ncbi:hypothetical protein F3Y22_tig00116937pilonHSYRG00269 [Hibiscus syriacus]|uniref:Reverse transcriptase zinc-binding domain-containing protein n=1 Tax=Hibiscus syriacus TaxID=106335 RepID=A0A6A2X2L2_HIBSY|nr:hypothetical protein F3Y22_tig00116937pilonHSYRG00269 [Hibiscus syriacus]
MGFLWGSSNGKRRLARVSWKRVGDGKPVLFWVDVWLWDKPFRSIFPRLLRLASNKRAVVADVISHADLNGENWSALFWRALLDREVVMVVELKQLISCVSICSCKIDLFMCIHDKDGIFRVKKLYQLIVDSDVEDPVFEFDKVWKLKVPLEVRNFLWMLMIYRIPRKEFLLSRDMGLEGLDCHCCWCESGVEEVNHLFVNCSVMVKFWKEVVVWRRIDWMSCRSVLDLISFSFSVNLNAKLKSIWLVSMAAAAWSIWLNRNEIVFNGKRFVFNDLIFFSKLRALVWLKALKDNQLVNEELWWENPRTCLNSTHILMQHATCLVFEIAGAASRGGSGCGALACDVFVEAGWIGISNLAVNFHSHLVQNWLPNSGFRPLKVWPILHEIDVRINQIKAVSFNQIPIGTVSMAGGWR